MSTSVSLLEPAQQELVNSLPGAKGSEPASAKAREAISRATARANPVLPWAALTLSSLPAVAACCVIKSDGRAPARKTFEFRRAQIAEAIADMLHCCRQVVVFT